MSSLSDFRRYGCAMYAVQRVVMCRGNGVRVWDEDDACYIDATAGYSANNLGHCHPRVMRIVERMGVVPNDYINPEHAGFVREACERFGYERALPLNTGVDMFEAAVKMLRKYAYTRSPLSIPIDHAEIICFDGNFHGRTIAAASASSEKQYRQFFGPHTPGFRLVPYGNAHAFERAINNCTIGTIIEPIQGEGGIVIPPAGYLQRIAEICKAHRMIFVADEVQTGLGRAGCWLASSYEYVRPDMVLLGKSLGGGRVAASALLTSDDIMVFEPREHGSTYGGNSFAMAIAREVLRVIADENLCENSCAMGDRLLQHLMSIESPFIRALRGRALMIGVELDTNIITPPHMLDRLLANGVLCKDAHGVIRVTPPLIISADEVDELAERMYKAFTPP